MEVNDSTSARSLDHYKNVVSHQLITNTSTEKNMEDPNAATFTTTANTTGEMTPPLLQPPESYDLGGKVMLTAIFCVLLTVVLLVLILHVFFRWYLHRRHNQIRRRQRRVRQQHLNFATEPAVTTNEGLDPVVLNSLPVFTYFKSSTSDDDEVDCDDYDEETEVNCAVCLCEFDEGEKGKTLPGCNHSFHVECIDMWLQSHSTCPLCRAVVELRARRDEVVVEMVGLTESCQHESRSGLSSFGWNLAMLMDIMNIGGCLTCDCARGSRVNGEEDLESGVVTEDERRSFPAEIQ